jgi:hypothetical protein
VSETTDQQSLFAGIEAFEAAAFRAGQQARAFLTARQDLPLPYSVYLAGAEDRSPFLLLTVNSEDDVQSWALALGVATTYALAPGQESVRPSFGTVQARAVVDGMNVQVAHGLMLSPEEWEARQAAQGQADTGSAGSER